MAAEKFWSGDSWKSFEFAGALEQADRFEDMLKVVTEVSQCGTDVLESSNRNLLSIAFKNVVGQRRSAYRVLNAKLEETDSKFPKEVVKVHMEAVVEDLRKYCNQAINLISYHILERLKDLDDDTKRYENEVFFYKMKGDYYRYMCETEDGDKRQTVKEEATMAYKHAVEVSDKLKPTHPIKLGLVLNYSVFLYEIASDGTEACKLAKQAFDAAISELESLEEVDYKDSTLIMQLLRDNLTLWSSDGNEPEEAEEAD